MIDLVDTLEYNSGHKGDTMTYEDVRRLFRYSDSTGQLYNKVSRGYKAEKGKISGGIWKDPNRENHKYRVIKVCGKEYKAHRIIWLYKTGAFPDGQIDHIDGNTLNNRWDNLRDVDEVKNAKNRSIQSNNTSGYHGINQLPSGNWRVRINDNKKRINIGTFPNYREAYTARLEAEIKYGYHANHGRQL